MPRDSEAVPRIEKFVLYTDHSALKWLRNIVDPEIRHSRWRLILFEFDFDMKYRKGSRNHIADAISRLPTFEYHTSGPELEIPSFLVESGNEKSTRPVTNVIDTNSWTKDDWDPFDFHEDERIINSLCTFSALAVDIEAELQAVTIDEVHQAREDDPECDSIRKELNLRRDTPFVEDERGLLVRVTEPDGICQIFVPRELRLRLLHLAHHTLLAGHPGITRQFYMMRSEWYWPSKITDVRAL